ncbi:MAG TPA: leucine zipper domain-containing protein [Methylocystis sp.]|jgi:transposase-like protein
MNNPHKNALTTPLGRAEMVRWIREGRLPLATVATGVGISERTARKWVKRFEAEGPAGLENRFSRPRMVANRTGEPCLAHLLVPEFETQQFLLAALAILWLAADSAILLSRSGALSNAPHASSPSAPSSKPTAAKARFFCAPAKR